MGRPPWSIVARLRPHLAPQLALLVALLAIFAPLLAGSFPEQRDLSRFTVPARAVYVDALRAGHLPEWNPYVGLGVAPLAAPVHGTFYPPQLLLLLPVSLPVAVAILWLLHAWLAGAGGYALGRALGCRPAAALVSGLAWAVGGYALAMWGNGEKVVSGAWIPWAALGLLELARAPSWRSPALVGAAAALALLALAGDPFLWLHAGLLGGALALGDARARPLAVLARGLGAVALAGLLAGVALVPAAALLGESERASGVVADEMGWSLAPARLLELVRPLGAQEHRWAISIYLGVMTPLALLAGRGRRTTWLAGVAVLATLLALGEHTPVEAAARAVFPPLGYMRYAEKHVLVAIGALALLAALGAERALAGQVRPPWLAVLALGAWASPLVAGLAAVAGLVLAVAPRRPRLGAALPAVVALDLVLAGQPLLRWLDRDQLTSPPAIAAGVARDDGAPPRVYRPRVPDPGLGSLPDNLGVIWGLAHVPGHDPTLPARLRQLWDAVSAQGERAVALFGIDQVLLPAREGGWRRLPMPPAPRARWIGQVEVAPDAAVVARLAAPDFDPARAAVVTAGPAARPLASAGTGRCELESRAATRLVTRCRADAEGLLLLVEGFAPGWRATLDGAPVPIVRADHVMRGVYLPAGEHVVEVRFATPGLAAGLAASLAGLAVAAALLVLARRRAVV
jgi:hypothetical protein